MVTRCRLVGEEDNPVGGVVLVLAADPDAAERRRFPRRKRVRPGHVASLEAADAHRSVGLARPGEVSALVKLSAQVDAVAAVGGFGVVRRRPKVTRQCRVVGQPVEGAGCRTDR